MRIVNAGILALALSGCISVSVDEHNPADAALVAFENARVLSCPAARTQANARSEGFGPTVDITAEDIAFTPIAHDPGHALRLRRISVAPGGVIAWHDHTALQGMALLVSGEMVEARNTCLDLLTYHAGDIAIEDAATAHGWRNESDKPAVIMVAHVVAR